jgi:hypothetical protein
LHEVDGVIVDPLFVCGSEIPAFCRDIVAALAEE